MKPVLEQIELGKKQSILVFEYNAPYFDTPWHFHPQHELVHIEESVSTKYIGDYVGFYVFLFKNLHIWNLKRPQFQCLVN
ncbi:hypothetical protein [Algibacter lectus]|uniref:Transcriptional regulator n=1 Tax=Algibacter lectus TaxID=221126 RepID=A0A090WYT2_9FLAO|nr:hypothetical protein [Algibacter lectus]MWW25322.1 hypothetical protein [Algibacter lectus]TDY64265.1 hypothetical protein DFQ06_1172 [Algibacter lectus]SFC01937.1 hypothetical protein SAMN04489722_101467 [Algibacter lectus]GAL64782.1 hypothetical protein JCM19300_3102 [Algibacter lectus]GAL80584.1 hypothetical protein JCM19274_1210 [Algibacter lectus]